MPEQGPNIGRGDEGRAERVTVAVGEPPKVYTGCYVRVDYAHGLVLVHDGPDRTAPHAATAPLGRTLIEWAEPAGEGG